MNRQTHFQVMSDKFMYMSLSELDVKTTSDKNSYALGLLHILPKANQAMIQA